MKRVWSQDIFSDFSNDLLADKKNICQKEQKKHRKKTTCKTKQKPIVSCETLNVVKPPPFYTLHLWSQIFQPSKIEELVITKKKLAEFESILFDPNKIIVISGPSGSGKHTLLKIIAEKHNIKIIKWLNLHDDNLNEHKDDFRDFLRSACYNNLPINAGDNADKILLIDDISSQYFRSHLQLKALLHEFSQRSTFKIIFIYSTKDTDCSISHFYSSFFEDKTLSELNASSIRQRKNIFILD
uniref:Cell cycle checkpoint protein RAD17 (Trinotate prediction) n=1 Tax=Henneguya salminicola TaxID=69463 RepID=A0A6G3MET4_HENSL